MQPLSKDRKIINNRIRYAHALFLLLDLDGTLVAAGSGIPKLKAKERELLGKLIALDGTHVGVISERPVEQVSKAIHVPGVHYSGSLGREYAVPGGAFIQFTADEVLARYEGFARELKTRASKTKGVKVDRLGDHLSTDWSKAAAAPRKAFADALKELETSYSDAVRVISGKQSADYLPLTGYDKGTATVAILRRVGFNLKSDLAICIGDDETNEDAFRAIGANSLAVRVGRARQSSAAHYTLKNVAEVWSFLQGILEIRSELRNAGLAPAARMF